MCKTTVVLVPAGCTSLVQPLDVVFNREFKNVTDRLQNKHMQNNLEQYINNSLTATLRRVLISKWVGAAWVEVSKKKDMVKRGFEKCGVSMPIDGSGDNAIKIRGLETYQVRCAETEEEDDPFDFDSSSEDED